MVCAPWKKSGTEHRNGNRAYPRETAVPAAFPVAIVLFAEVNLNYHMAAQTCGRIARFRSHRLQSGHERHPERMQ